MRFFPLSDGRFWLRAAKKTLKYFILQPFARKWRPNGVALIPRGRSRLVMAAAI